MLSNIGDDAMAQLKGKQLEMAKKIQAVLKEHGYEQEHYRITTDPDLKEGRIVIKFRAVDANGMRLSDIKINEERNRFRQNAALLGMKPEWLDTEIYYGGKSYRITGLVDRERSDKTVSVMNERGKKYVLSVRATIIGKQMFEDLRPEVA